MEDSPETHSAGPMSDGLMSQFVFWFSLVVTNSLSALCMLTNTVNMVMFVKQGLKERVNFTLFCLSICDFCSAVFPAVINRSLYGDVQDLGRVTEWSSYVVVVSEPRNMFVDLSTALTVYISLERCTCVVFPFHFSTSVIARKAPWIIFAIAAFVIVFYLPKFGTIEFTTSQNPVNNMTIYILDYKAYFVIYQTIIDFLFGVVSAAVCQLCIFVCAVLMHRGLRKSAQVRRCENQDKNLHGMKSHKNYVMSNKERKIVRMIFLLACLYMVTSTPQIIVSWLRIINPEMVKTDPSFPLLLLLNLVMFLTSANGAFSLFIYFNYSTSYRSVFYSCIDQCVTPCCLQKNSKNKD